MQIFSIALRFVQYSGVCAIRFGDCAARVKGGWHHWFEVG